MKYIPLIVSIVLLAIAAELWMIFNMHDWALLALIFSLYFFIGYHLERIEKLINKK
jgi:hypothetical protein